MGFEEDARVMLVKLHIGIWRAFGSTGLPKADNAKEGGIIARVNFIMRLESC